MSGETANIPAAEFLDPRETRLERTAEGRILLVIGEKSWPDVQVRLAFPLSQGGRMVSLLDPEEQYLGTLCDFQELESGSRQVVEEELKQQYFCPTLLRILSLRKRFGLVEMEAITEAGSRLIRFRSPRDDIRELSPGRYLLTDAAGSRFELPCLEALDESSRVLWHNLV